MAGESPERSEMTTARELMTHEPKIVAKTTSATDAARLLADEGIGALVVCNDDRRLQGVVTDRDIAVGVVAPGKDPSAVTVAELVDESEVATIGADDSVEDAISTMKEHAVRRLPVIDGTDVVGFLSQADIAGQVDADQVKDLLAAISASDDNTDNG